MVDENGNSDQTAEFTPYGETRSQSGALSNYLFSGKSERSGDPDWSGERDNTGLYYFGPRYYRSIAEIRRLPDDPALGRWLSTDPVPEGKPAGSGQFHSPYVYAGNNPLVMVDPDGEWGFLLPTLYGALTGGSVSGLTYFAMAGQDATWQGFTRAFATGALTGAVSGGLSMAFTSMGTGMSANIGYTLLGNASTYAATTAVTGGDLTLGGFAGAVSGGIMGGTLFGSYQPIADGAFRNIFGELIYGGVHGSFIGSLSGGIASAIDYGDFAGGFNRGMSVGGVSGFAQSAVNLSIHGYARMRTPTTEARSVKAKADIADPGVYESSLRTGGISRKFSNRGYSWYT
jgi:RHS repeat-associated protein